ncbi:MAG: hypothetical protein PHC80_02895 [Eubacteriales bacterium]|nr:hypothetical protein [Eubacteriales bacterium]
MKPELIVMLTHNDRTVENAPEIFEACKNSKAKFWGFKEVGLPIDKMKKLCADMKAARKTTFLEIVAYTEEECLAGAKIGVECGFDYLMGTMYFDSVRDLLRGAGVKYMPFVGDVRDRPSVVYGTIESTIQEGLDLIKDHKIDGVDLLGYRFVGDAVKLNHDFVAAIQPYGPVCLAGSVSSYQRLDEVASTGAWAFTIGGAFFENKFDGTFAEQIDKVVDYMNAK